MPEPKIKVFWIKYPECSTAHLVKESDIPSAVQASLEDMDEGDEIRIGVDEMTQAELDAVPESDGC